MLGPLPKFDFAVNLDVKVEHPWEHQSAGGAHWTVNSLSYFGIGKTIDDRMVAVS